MPATAQIHQRGGKSATRLLRPKQVYGKDAPLPVGRTKFGEDFVKKPGGPDNIPGTTIARLRPVRIGLRAIAFFADEVEAVVEALRQHRDQAG